MDYTQALHLLKTKMQSVIDKANDRFANDRYPRFYEPILYLTDLKHYKRRKQIKPFVILGAGMFSLVVKHPKVPGVVFKIHGADGYIEYVNYSKTHFSPVHVKVFDRVYVDQLMTELTEEDISITVIEELQPIELSEENKDMMRNMKLFEENKEFNANSIPSLILEHMYSMKALSLQTQTRLDIWHNVMQRKNKELVSIDPLVYDFL